MIIQFSDAYVRHQVDHELILLKEYDGFTHSFIHEM